LFALIIEGVLGGSLEWGLVITGVLIAVAVELMGVAALPFAVGMYLPLSSSSPIFIGGALRWLADRWRGKPASEAEAETSPGVLLSSGYIAGGTLIGLVIAFLAFAPRVRDALDLSAYLDDVYNAPGSPYPKIVAVATFATIAAILFWIASRKDAAKTR
jgi:uncharacterized oligopeptide transporter (OPT) family protein